MQFQIPCFPISYRTRFADFLDVFEDFMTIAEEQTGSCPPLLIFEPHPDWSIHGRLPIISDAPEELVVVPLEPSVRAACFQALERVEAREPKHPIHPPKKSLKFNDNTPVKGFFRKMAEMPMTALSLTFSDNGPDAISIFFLRTPFTVSQFRREITQPIE